MTTFTPWPALAGGLLIGLASSSLLLLNGRIAGISGIVDELVYSRDQAENSWRTLFLVGLIAGGVVLRVAAPDTLPTVPLAPMAQVAVAGLLVGFGARLGGGCTSGHGVCGTSRLSTRSVTATCIFIGTGALAVFVQRALVGGGS